MSIKELKTIDYICNNPCYHGASRISLKSNCDISFEIQGIPGEKKFTLHIMKKNKDDSRRNEGTELRLRGGMQTGEI